jgi:hypothetical protein
MYEIEREFFDVVGDDLGIGKLHSKRVKCSDVWTTLQTSVVLDFVDPIRCLGRVITAFNYYDHSDVNNEVNIMQILNIYSAQSQNTTVSFYWVR